MFKFILIFAVIGVAVYAGIVIGTPYLNYNSFDSAVKQIIDTRFEGAEEIKKMIFLKSKDFSIPISEDDVVMSINDKGKLTVNIQWSVTVNLHDIYKKEYNFKVEHIK